MCTGNWLAFTNRESWAGFLGPRDGGTAEEMGERRWEVGVEGEVIEDVFRLMKFTIIPIRPY